VIAHVLIAAIALVLGAIGGVTVVGRWYVGRLRDPEVARAMLKGIYRQSHGHWLQRSETDTTPVCPCCGWSETEALAQPPMAPGPSTEE
jgi:hypothetical protein